MNRNVESHFSMLPSAEISRSRFDRSQDIKFTCNVGELVPFFVDTTVMPGDTFDITSSKVIRLQTLIDPVFDNLYADFYWFFIPHRLVWSHWRELMGENTASAWIPQVAYTVPQIKGYSSGYGGTSGYGQIRTGSVFDYMGIPVVNDSGNAYEFEFSALAWRAYCLTFNEWFRDENLTDPVNWSNGDADLTVMTIQGLDSNGNVENGDKCFKVAKFHDYFTSCLPSAQKGPPVQIPAGFDLNTGPGWPVMTQIYESGGTEYRNISQDTRYPMAFARTDTGARISNPYVQSGDISSTNTFVRNGSSQPTSTKVFPDNLFAFPADNQQTGLYMLVNDLRYAFQLQKLYERDARGGSRYIELIKSHFGVSSPDARMQRPEYLGGNRIPVSIHQIVNQAQTQSDNLGDLGAMSLTTDKNHDFVKSFSEHGTLLGCMCLRYNHSYPQGLNRMWSQKTRFDFYWPVFANLGEQAVLKKEIMLTGDTTDDDVFGYQERWAEYRYMPDRVAGEMRPGISNTLASWHFADYYTTVPTLSDAWIREDKTNVDRALAVTSQVSNQVLCDVYVKNYTTRPMPMYSIPGLIDHH